MKSPKLAQSDKLIELALRQLDKVGFELSKRGFTNQFNRHNCIAQIMTGEQRIRGELNRASLKIGLHKAKIRHLKKDVKARLTLAKGQAEDVIDHCIDRAPDSLSGPLTRIKSLLH